LADDEYIRSLATLIKTGVDPATGKKTTEPLDPSLKVWIEYSNEVWNWNFGQSNWVNKNIEGKGDIDAKYARKASSVYETFRETFGDNDRVVRVIGSQLGFGGGKRTRDRLKALDRSQYDAVAVTTYFELDMRQWISDNRKATVDEAMDALLARVGEGPFKQTETEREPLNAYWHYHFAKEFNVPIISYEGNDHINPVGRVTVDGKTKRLTEVRPDAAEFIHNMARHPKMGEVYKRWLDRHHQSGLKTNVPFVLLAGWSQYGQWGHVEYVGQPVEQATKYKALLDFYKIPYPELRAAPKAK
jgi:hypothetical protein